MRSDDPVSAQDSFAGSHTDTVMTTSRRSQTEVDLTCQHNQALLVEGPEITIRPVSTCRRVTSDVRWTGIRCQAEEQTEQPGEPMRSPRWMTDF